MIDEIKGDVQTAIAELRSLAHGIFPPLLVSGGLAEALPAAAARSPLPTTVDTSGIGRYGADMEAAVYFCVLEALQNAGKHAGEAATRRRAGVGHRRDPRLRGQRRWCGLRQHRGLGDGHGFVNMADRLGAFGGTSGGALTTGRGDDGAW